MARAARALAPLLEAQVQGLFSQAQGRRRNDRLEKARWPERIGVFGAERMRGELLQLGIRVGKRTIEKSMRTLRTHQPPGQTWATDLEPSRRTDLGLRRAFW
jgi:hypothetical protein